MACRYWNNQGRFQPEYDRLYALVPSWGEAPTLATEVVRCLGNLVYERFNNGNGNRGVKIRHGRFLAGLRVHVGTFVASNPGVFPAPFKAFGEACKPVLGMTGGSRQYEAETDVVCDAYIKYASVLAGEPVEAKTQTEEAFLRCIGENPRDANARLAYADWLAERDMGDRSRAVKLHAYILTV